MKDVVLISAYCDNEEKLKMLHNLLVFLKSKNKKIILSTHLACDTYLQNYCDYYIFDRENEIIRDKKYFGSVYFLCEQFDVFTKNAGSTNTCLAVLKSLFSGINLANFYGYDVLHYIEYDTYMNDTTELDENLSILHENPEVNSVAYLEGDQMLGNYFAINLKKIEHKKFTYDVELIKEKLIQHGICENLIRHYFFENKSHFKSSLLIRNEEFKSQLVQSGYLRWGIVLFDNSNNKYMVFLFNHLNDEHIIFNVIEDNTCENILIRPKNYYVKYVNNNIRYIKIFGNNILYQDYDLQSEIHINEIKNNSSISFKK